MKPVYRSKARVPRRNVTDNHMYSTSSSRVVKQSHIATVRATTEMIIC